MIKIKLYKNGFEINGHSDPSTCGEVSMLAWAYSNTIHNLDASSNYYTSKNDEDSTKHNEGYTWMTLDIGNFMANWIFEEYVINLEEWANEMWGDRVKIIKTNEVLVKH